MASRRSASSLALLEGFLHGFTLTAEHQRLNEAWSYDPCDGSCRRSCLHCQHMQCGACLTLIRHLEIRHLRRLLLIISLLRPLRLGQEAVEYNRRPTLLSENAMALMAFIQATQSMVTLFLGTSTTRSTRRRSRRHWSPASSLRASGRSASP